MKPISLRLTAFGPYKYTETINFKDLKNNRLFVVSGKTGAGKTTIFDGICFALYGSASGEDRNDTKMLRSDFADDDVHTSAELIFELNGRFYRVLRQLGHVKKGNKSPTGEKYEFYEQVEDKEIPCVDRQIVTEINQKIEQLIGLTMDQFSQIVMLPQGEFRKLLTSQTENKEAILRRIFKTEPYRQIGEKLKEKKKVAEESFKQAEQQLSQYISGINATLPERDSSLLFQVLAEDHYNVHQVLTGLDEEITFYQDKIAEDEKNYHQAYRIHDQKQMAYHQAKAINDRFQQLNQKQERLKQLQEQVPIFTEKESTLQLAEKASQVEVHENHYQDWLRTVKEKQTEQTQAKSHLEKVTDQLNRATNVYEHEQAKTSEREKVAKQLDKLTEYLPVVKEIDDQKQQLANLYQQVTQQKKDYKALESQVTKAKENKQKLSSDIKVLEQSTNTLIEKQEQLLEMREQYRKIDEFIKLRDKQQQLKQQYENKQELFTRTKADYATLENDWINGQASVLAAHLHDGQACPVCGSVEHPHKNDVQHDSPTKEQLQAAKKHLDQVETDYRNVMAQFENQQKQVQQKQEEIEEITTEIDGIDALRKSLKEQGQELNKETEQLKTDKQNLEKQRQAYEKLEKELEQLDSKMQQIIHNYNELKTNYESKLAVYKEKVESIPEQVRQLSELEKQIQQVSVQKEKLDQAWESAQKQLEAAKQTFTKAETDFEHANKQVDEAKSKTEAAENAFIEALTKADFQSSDAYTQAKIPEQTREQLKEEINQFKQSLSLLEQQVKELKESLQDHQQVDIQKLEEELEHYRRAYESAFKEWNQSKDFHKDATELKVNIMEANQQVIEQEKLWNQVADLYDVIRGQNSSKISFERYLQIEYLEQIIHAANERLKRISNGQFYLMRSDRMESRGKQSGLGLDVYDAYTGQTRDVKTLSGGEKFNASLCLALGMADVIQSFQGGVSIDTMFIDEGFGSLDDESLNNAIDTLIDLQKSGRMIGVISHVQELKTAIPAILQVEKTKEGYSKTKFVVQ
ncbi:AAA family ATPase [Aquibacillus sediminis]|uniref:AAA family ATPase n=1 Tax=Aquibacillus sediminis TaxID=2574734 RepID=UPI00110941B2|nr:SMC family ATPase [Aquibacillus sediminis]